MPYSYFTSGCFTPFLTLVIANVQLSEALYPFMILGDLMPPYMPLAKTPTPSKTNETLCEKPDNRTDKNRPTVPMWKNLL
ncbi:hypothetical protein ZORO111902_07890 [Zobellia roscoffensis]